MAPAAQQNLYTSADDVAALLSALGRDARLDDDFSATLDGDESPFLLQCREWATAQVKFYCQPHYDDAELSASWLANEWATVLAAVRLCSRRLNAVPDSLRALCYGDIKGDDQGVMGDLRDVRRGRAKIPETARRTPDDGPAWSNVTVDPRYRLRQLRVQRPISEQTPAQYPQTVDWRAEHTLEF